MEGASAQCLHDVAVRSCSRQGVTPPWQLQEYAEAADELSFNPHVDAVHQRMKKAVIEQVQASVCGS